MKKKVSVFKKKKKRSLTRSKSVLFEGSIGNAGKAAQHCPPGSVMMEAGHRAGHEIDGKGHTALEPSVRGLSESSDGHGD